jgi:hypothetical protein
MLGAMGNGKSHARLIIMGSRHKGSPESTRVPEGVAESARAVLGERGWTAHAFLAACLAALGEHPDELLALVAAYRPEGRRTGRPRKAIGDPPPQP